MPTKDNLLINLPNPKLRQKSQKVAVITPEMEQLIENMKATTLDWEEKRDHEIGVALAAIQIGQPYRVVIVRNDFDNKDDKTFVTFINPVITKLEGEIVEDYEGCLSVKDIYGKVPRYSKVRVRATDENGREIRVKAEGFLARIFQHEIDHTNGIVFVDHIAEDKDKFYKLDAAGRLEKLDYDTVVEANLLRD